MFQGDIKDASCHAKPPDPFKERVEHLIAGAPADDPLKDGAPNPLGKPVYRSPKTLYKTAYSPGGVRIVV